MSKFEKQRERLWIRITLLLDSRSPAFDARAKILPKFLKNEFAETSGNKLNRQIIKGLLRRGVP
jgi:hypothetical protein